MTKYSKFNIIYLLQKWMDSVPGQTFLNYAYSWGASIVILGTLFKLTHLPGANMMLFIGMGTEVIVFFLSAFDRPFDKTTIGMDLKTESQMYEDEDSADLSASNESPSVSGAQPSESGTAYSGPAAVNIPAVPNLVSQQNEMLPEMKEAAENYVAELNRLTDTLKQMAEQSQRMINDSVEMDNMNRTLTGISRVYEMQLKSASSQIGTIDEINEQSKKMAEQISELNKIYARMIDAMTANLKN